MSIFDHYRKDELPFVERALEMLKQVERKQSMRLTDFMDPRQAHIVQSLTSQVADVRVEASGGYGGAERVRAVIHPAYLAVEQADFQLALMEIKGDQRFLQLQHKDVLGALLHIGLKREKFGDILLDEHGCQFVLANEMVDYVRSQVTHVHRLPEELIQIDWEQVRIGSKISKEKTITVPSLRMDAVIGEVLHLSRAKVLVPIRAGKVKVNWKISDNPADQLEAGDMISVGGFGRFQLKEIAGPTRSGRLRVTVGIL